MSAVGGIRAGKMALTVNGVGVASAPLPVATVQVAVHVAEKLLQFGAIPLTFSDSSGHVYEPEVSRNRIEDCILARVLACSVRIGSASVSQERTASQYTWRHHYVLCVRCHHQTLDAKPKTVNCTILGCVVHVVHVVHVVIGQNIGCVRSC